MTDEIYLTPDELAQRWKVTTNHLGGMRFRKEGPACVKLGQQKGTGAIRYLLASVEEYERRQRSQPVTP